MATERGATGGKGSSRGTPQGGVVSPLLANLYMNRFLEALAHERTGCGLSGLVIAYADDFVILSRGRRLRHGRGR